VVVVVDFKMEQEFMEAGQTAFFIQPHEFIITTEAANWSLWKTILVWATTIGALFLVGVAVGWVVWSPCYALIASAIQHSNRRCRRRNHQFTDKSSNSMMAFPETLSLKTQPTIKSTESNSKENGCDEQKKKLPPSQFYQAIFGKAKVRTASSYTI